MELERRPQWTDKSRMSEASSVRSSEQVGKNEQASVPDEGAADSLESSSNPRMLPIISPGGQRVV
eukprot:5615114-Pyramimonas_sp.AAC.1